jgi:hypothetical protein
MRLTWGRIGGTFLGCQDRGETPREHPKSARCSGGGSGRDSNPQVGLEEGFGHCLCDADLRRGCHGASWAKVGRDHSSHQGPRPSGADLVVGEAEISRLTSAIARAPDLGSLLDALRAKEQHRTALRAELTALDGMGRCGRSTPRC